MTREIVVGTILIEGPPLSPNLTASKQEHRMPMSRHSPGSEMELRWRAWQEKGKRADRLADKWMKVLFSVVGVILLVWILFYVFRAKALPDPSHAQRAAACDHISSLVA